jgi:hypothetical protein
MGAALLAAGPALAQAYPELGIKIVVGFPPGVAPDITARLLADKFGETWGKPVVVENVTGAGSNIATDRVAKAPPDGYTLLMGGNLASSSAWFMRLPAIRPSAPISQVFIGRIFRGSIRCSAKTLPDWARPGTQTASHLRGTPASAPQHLAASCSNIGAHRCPAGRLSGTRRRCWTSSPDASPCRSRIFSRSRWRGGQTDSLAVTSRERSSAAPDMPTMADPGSV